ncbi:MAG: MBL fold metallo-hydrolase [Lachnospiraceae bacterium]|nr:MBL fold metallo-hydrolase [Lachnospiraceae bacterium]
MRICRLTVGPISTNCYIIVEESKKRALIVDPGGDADRIMNKIKELQVSVEAILLTHGHFDHMLAADTLREKYQVKVYLGQDDSELIKNPMENVSGMFGKPMSTHADVLLRDGQVLELAGFEIKVLATPGHTKGGVCYYIEKESVAFSGDTIFQASVGRSDFPTGSGASLSKSIREKIFTLPEDTQLFPGHGDSTVVSYEKKYNMFV